MGMPNCGRRLLRRQQMQAMRQSCGRLCSNESFITVDHMQSFAVICVISLT